MTTRVYRRGTMKPHNQLTIIRNRHRAKELRTFRGLVEAWFERSQIDPDDIVMDWHGAQEARSRINQMLPRVLQIVEAAGLDTAPPLATVTDPGLSLARLEVLRNIFRARFEDGLDQEILDVLDMAIGVYDGGAVMALARTINPLHYLGTAVAFVARAPRRLARLLGFGRTPHPVAGRGPDAYQRLPDVDAMIESRLAVLHDRSTIRQADLVRQMAELAERLDFAERVLAQHRAPRIKAPDETGIPTPV
jgi:hypothetical protein